MYHEVLRMRRQLRDMKTRILRAEARTGARDLVQRRQFNRQKHSLRGGGWTGFRVAKQRLQLDNQYVKWTLDGNLDDNLQNVIFQNQTKTFSLLPDRRNITNDIIYVGTGEPDENNPHIIMLTHKMRGLHVDINGTSYLLDLTGEQKTLYEWNSFIDNGVEWKEAKDKYPEKRECLVVKLDDGKYIWSYNLRTPEVFQINDPNLVVAAKK